MAVELALQLAEDAGPRRQVVERRIGGVPPIAVGPAPGPPGRVLGRQHAARDLQFGPEIFETGVHAKRRLIDRSRKKWAQRHRGAPRPQISGCQRTWASGASSK